MERSVHERTKSLDSERLQKVVRFFYYYRYFQSYFFLEKKKNLYTAVQSCLPQTLPTKETPGDRRSEEKRVKERVWSLSPHPFPGTGLTVQGSHSTGHPCRSVPEGAVGNQSASCFSHPSDQPFGLLAPNKDKSSRHCRLPSGQYEHAEAW